MTYLLSARPIKELEEQLATIYNDVANETDTKKQNKLMKKIDSIQNRLNYYDVYEAENILLKIISGMHIDDDLLYKNLNELSGGQKSKIAFARLLYSKPEIMLLDEPTNHLDSKSKDYIVNYLKNYHGGVFIISHDNDFLDKVTNKTLYLDKRNHNMMLYDGSYSKFMKVKKLTALILSGLTAFFAYRMRKQYVRRRQGPRLGEERHADSRSELPGRNRQKMA